MQVREKIIVVTGAGSGIGKALVAKFVTLGNSVVAVDIDAEAARQTASEYGCLAMSADVANENDVLRVIEETEKSLGAIDLYCSNAGVSLGADEQSANSEWQVSWDVNVMSHV